MEKKLVQHGNSQALILDKTILKLLKANKETTFELKIEGNSLIITPTKKGKGRIISKNKNVQMAYEEAMEEYDEALEKLSKN